MKKILGIVVLGLLLSGNVYADERCTVERKQWIKFYKQDFARNFTKIEYEND
jgi:hypothetical protein